jgi:hypothetical protein
MTDKYLLELPKEQLLTLMTRMLVYTNRWAYVLEKRLEELEDEEDFLRMQIELYKELGFREGKGLKKMGLADGEGADAIINALKYSHWAALESLHFEKKDNNTFRFGVKDCSAIQVMGEEQKKVCIRLGLHLRQGFAEGVDKRAKVSVVDDDKDFSCLWEVRTD